MSQDSAKNRHEKFEVADSTSVSKRLKVVRQDRISNNGDEIFLEIQQSKYEVINYSSFGLAIKAPKDFNVLSECEGTFTLNDIEIANLHLKLRRLETDTSDENNIAFEIVGEPLNIHTVNAVKMSLSIIKEHVQARTEEGSVPSEFRKIVYEMKDYLENVKARMIKAEEEISKFGNRYADEYRDTIAVVIGKYMFDTTPAYYNLAAKALENIDEKAKKECLKYFRNKMSELIYHAPIVDRIYNKPLGYAGDYEMMNIIYKTHASGLTLFDKCVHNLFIRDPAAEAVRNRAEYLAHKIKNILSLTAGRKIKILSVACGPSMEWQLMALRDTINKDTEIELHLLDQDENALKNAQFELKKLLKNYKNIEVKYVHLAIKNVIARGLPSSDFDLIYSAGLFDYFSEPVAHLATEKLMFGLKDEGKLIIGNFNTTNPSKAVMEIALDWNLIYRSESDLFKMYSHYGKHFEIEKEQLGINLFCIITK